VSSSQKPAAASRRAPRPQPGAGREAARLSRAKPSTPSPRRFLGAVAGVRGARLYLDTHIATSPKSQVFRGSTVDYLHRERRKRRNRTILAVADSLRKLGHEEQASALIGCGRWFKRYQLPCWPEDRHELRPLPCNSIFCPDCANRRSRPHQQNVLRRMQPEKFDYWHLVLTVRNELELTRQLLDRLIEMFADLRASDVWNHIPLPGTGEAGKITGGVYSLESILSCKRHDWHPHLHVIIETPKKLPRWWLWAVKTAWWFLTDGSDVIRLDKVYGLSKEGKKRRKINMRSVRELVKYATKSASFSDSPERVKEFMVAFRHVRRVQYFGSWLGAGARARKEENELEKPAERCTKGSWIVHPELFHESETLLLPDGTRQLRAFGTGPPRRPRFNSVQEWQEWLFSSPLPEPYEAKQARLVLADLQWRRGQAALALLSLTNAYPGLSEESWVQ